MTESARHEHQRHEHHHAGYGIDARAGIRALAHMSELEDYRIADNGPDIRGWRVATAEGRVGCVRDLLVDTAAMSVRYLDVELDAPASSAAPADAPAPSAPPERARRLPTPAMLWASRRSPDTRHVLVPLRIADLDEEHHEVHLSTITGSELGCLPEYRGEPVTPEREREVAACFERPRA
jgi:hypothetical protein